MEDDGQSTSYSEHPDDDPTTGEFSNLELNSSIPTLRTPKPTEAHPLSEKLIQTTRRPQTASHCLKPALKQPPAYDLECSRRATATGRTIRPAGRQSENPPNAYRLLPLTGCLCDGNHSPFHGHRPVQRRTTRKNAIYHASAPPAGTTPLKAENRKTPPTIFVSPPTPGAKQSWPWWAQQYPLRRLASV